MAFAVAIANRGVFFAAVSARFLKYWLPLLLWMALIFAASTGAGSPRVSSFFLRPLLLWLDPGMSDETFEKIHFCTRKTAHLTEYAVLGFLALRAARGEPSLQRAGLRGQVAAALLFAALYASTDEFHQNFVATRHPSVVDVLIDTTGAALGISATVLELRLRRAQ